MSKKDYVAIARVISIEMANTGADGRVSLTAVALGLCDVFEEDNGNFDRPRFLRACGIRT